MSPISPGVTRKGDSHLFCDVWRREMDGRFAAEPSGRTMLGRFSINPTHSYNGAAFSAD